MGSAALEALKAIASAAWKRTRDPYWKARLKWLEKMTRILEKIPLEAS